MSKTRYELARYTSPYMVVRERGCGRWAAFNRDYRPIFSSDWPDGLAPGRLHPGWLKSRATCITEGYRPLRGEGLPFEYPDWMYEDGVVMDAFHLYLSADGPLSWSERKTAAHVRRSTRGRSS